MVRTIAEIFWSKFVNQAFSLLKPNGYLVFIHPLSWLSKNSKIHNDILKHHIIWLKLWDASMSKEFIKGEIPISIYVLHNVINTDKKTEVISIFKRQKINMTSTVYLDKKYSIPLAYHTIFEKLIKFIESKNLQLEYHTKTIKSSEEENKLPEQYTLEDKLAVSTYRIKDGIMVRKAINVHPDAHKRKLIIANKTSFKGVFIDDGKLSLTTNHKFYILGDNLQLIKKIFTFKITDIIVNCCKYRQNFLEKEAFSFIPDIRKLGINDITEEDFYKLIELTDDEIELIKNITIQRY